MGRQPYTYGSAASKLGPERKPRSRRIAKGPPEKQPRRAPEPKHSLDDVLRHTVALTVCIACTVMLLDFCVRNERHVRQAEPARSETQQKLDGRKEVNDALQVELNRKQGLEHIRDLTINRYGSIQPGPDQVIYYNRAERGYVRQYGEIPRETESGK